MFLENNKIILIGLVLFCFQNFAQDSASFQLCKGQNFPYYHPELKYEGGFWEIKQHFLKDYPQSLWNGLDKNTGIVVVQFKVNCIGESGDFKLFSTDFKYQRMKLDSRIEDYFSQKAKELQRWIPAKDENGKTVNSHKFFSFRVEKGKLIEILPK